MKFLFIGGAADGWWIDVHYTDHPPALYSVATPTRPKTSAVYPPDSDITLTIERDNYRRSSWSTPEGIRLIYVKTELKDGDAFDMLMNKYRKP